MLMVQGPLDVVDRCVWHAAAFEDIQPLFGGFLLCSILNQAIDICPVFHAVAIGDKPSIGLPLRETKTIREHTEETIVATTEKNVTVEGLVTPVWYNRC
jgi:hypothetical protein